MDLTPPTDPPGAVWFAKLALIVNASVQSGTTANRPTQGLFVGRFYFDTDLAAGVGRPIWRNTLNTAWVDSTGTVV